MAANRFLHNLGRTLATCIAVTGLLASEHHGIVKSNGLPVPGASVRYSGREGTVQRIAGDQVVVDFNGRLWSLPIAELE